MNRIFLTGVFPPEMHSLGDHAQRYALGRFLSEKFSDYEVVTYYRSDDAILEKLDRSVGTGDLIFISSSGDFGDKHFTNGWHEKRKRIIERFKDNRVIQLPVSVCYEKPSAFESDKSFFVDQPHFTLLTRTPQSADLLGGNFGCDVRFFPDFVFNLKYPQQNCKRDGALLVLRNDAEACFIPTHPASDLMNRFEGFGFPGRVANKVLRTLGYRQHVLDFGAVARKVGRVCSPIHLQDVMVTDYDLTDAERERHVLDTLDFFSKFKVVVTDRFHAAVFAQLTGTPCVALPTGISDKISGCSGLLPNTVFANSLKKLPIAVRHALKTTFKETNYARYFDSFRSIVFSKREPTTCSPASSVIDLIKSRRSTRKFTGTVIEPREIQLIVEAGVYAPSAANMQATRFKVVTDKALIERVCEQSSPWLRNSNPAVVIAVLYNLAQPNKVGVSMLDPKEPWQRFIWQDTAVAMQNMMLAAESVGLKSCWVSVPPKHFGCQEQQLRAALDVPPNLLLACLLFLGYSNQKVNVETAWHQGYPIKRNLKGAMLS